MEATNQEKLDSISNIIKDNSAKQGGQIQDLNEQIKKVLELSNLEIEDLETLDDEDLAIFAAKVAKKPATRISRMATAQLGISNQYYKNVNQQSVRSFQIARTLSLVGGIVFIFTIVIGHLAV
ncbi:MAG: hypothetical protein H0V70_22805 [Ktedonobacteraceae bacterium]|nr:hypothetical protein [Ktedonobacteraceae bacterium]